MSTGLKQLNAQRFIIFELFKTFSILCVEIATRRLLTNRNIAIEIAKRLNFDPQAKVNSGKAERSTPRNIEQSVFDSQII